MCFLPLSPYRSTDQAPDISPASGGNPAEPLSPGIPREHRFACSRPFHSERGASNEDRGFLYYLRYDE